MKHLDRAVALMACLCLLLVGILCPALLLAREPAFYRMSFRACGIYEEMGRDGKPVRTPIGYLGGVRGQVGRFTDGQLDTIILHITDFLFGDTEDFALVMDGVEVNGTVRDGVSVFGEEAASHMKDVRELMRFAAHAANAACLVLLLSLLYLLWRRREVGGSALLSSFLFLLLLAVPVLAVFRAARAAGGDFAASLWQVLHHLFFPFSPDKVAGSFFNDALTMLLTLDFFMGAVYLVLGTLLLLLLAWLGFAVYLVRAARR